MDAAQLTRIATARGFVAALDQSGGSTPAALARYGIPPEAYSGDAEMYAAIHAFRTRIVTSSVFASDMVLAAILFEQTMDRDIDDVGVPDYLWDVKGIVPFVKVDRGLAEVVDGVRPMKPMPDLDALLERALARHVFGTKMRSLVQAADQAGIDAVLDQQFELGTRILAAGLMPILEPEVDINAPDKAAAEDLVTAGILDRLATLPTDAQVMLKLTIPTEPDRYAELIGHPSVLRVVALSGGYSRDEANRRLDANHGLIASFSRALTEGLEVDMTDAEFDAALAASIGAIYEASIA